MGLEIQVKASGRRNPAANRLSGQGVADSLQQRLQASLFQQRNRFLVDALAITLSRRQVATARAVGQRRNQYRPAGIARAQGDLEPLIKLAFDQEPNAVANLADADGHGKVVARRQMAQARQAALETL